MTWTFDALVRDETTRLDLFNGLAALGYAVEWTVETDPVRFGCGAHHFSIACGNDHYRDVEALVRAAR